MAPAPQDLEAIKLSLLGTIEHIEAMQAVSSDRAVASAAAAITTTTTDSSAPATAAATTTTITDSPAPATTTTTIIDSSAAATSLLAPSADTTGPLLPQTPAPSAPLMVATGPPGLQTRFTGDNTILTANTDVGSEKLPSGKYFQIMRMAGLQPPAAMDDAAAKTFIRASSLNLTARDTRTRAKVAEFKVGQHVADLNHIAKRTFEGLHTPTGQKCSVKTWATMGDLNTNMAKEMIKMLNALGDQLPAATRNQYLISLDLKPRRDVDIKKMLEDLPEDLKPSKRRRTG